MPVLIGVYSVVLVLVLMGCSSSNDNDDPAVENPTNADVSGEDMDSGQTPTQTQATYRVTFTDFWTAESFPTRFPASRHFSGLIGATHNEQVVFWESGQPATNGIREMAELGSKPVFTEEIESEIANGTANAVLSGDGIGRSPGSASIEFTLDTNYPQLTLVSMVAPSPDWFVGVRNLDLRDETGSFVDQLIVPLPVYDAGTDSGTTFTSGNQNSAGEVISQLSCQPADCDIEAGIHRDTQSSVRYLGEFLFERLN